MLHSQYKEKLKTRKSHTKLGEDKLLSLRKLLLSCKETVSVRKNLHSFCLSQNSQITVQVRAAIGLP